MKLFNVHLYLIATIADRLGRKREANCHRRFVIMADDEASAQQRAADWLSELQAKPAFMGIEFGNGRRDAIAVRLADTAQPIVASLVPEGLVRL